MAFGGIQVAVDVMLVSPLLRDGSSRPRADSEPGLALREATERKRRATYPEFQGATLPPHRFRCKSWRPLGKGGGGFPAEARLWPGSRQPRGAARRGRIRKVGADACDCGPNRVREQPLRAAHGQRAGRVCQRAARGRRAVRRRRAPGA